MEDLWELGLPFLILNFKMSDILRCVRCWSVEHYRTSNNFRCRSCRTILRPRCTVICKFLWGGYLELSENLGFLNLCVLLHFYYQIFQILLRGTRGAPLSPPPHVCIYVLDVKHYNRMSVIKCRTILGVKTFYASNITWRQTFENVITGFNIL